MFRGTLNPASFRDPSGFVFTRAGTLYRQVQECAASDYDLLMTSGLYARLVGEGVLVPHEEVGSDLAAAPGAHRVLAPAQVEFVSYPYEWCFSQLKDAALLTLAAQRAALECGLWLKDASAYNVQFHHGRPLFIDTLSFARHQPGEPWPAYRQFCQHFLAPLALMSRVDVRLGRLMRPWLDGIPLDLAARLLPGRTRLNLALLAHIHVHGAAQKRYEGRHVRGAAHGRVSRTALLGLVDSLEGAVRACRWQPAGTEWAEYYGNTNYTEEAMDAKQRSVAELLERVSPRPRVVWDLGANTGVFSRIAARTGALTVAWDIDPAAVERNYLRCREEGETHVLPLLQDLTNPSPGLGWNGAERAPLVGRGPADVALALALVHHLAIGGNVPLPMVADFLAAAARSAIVEFVPRADSQVQRLLAAREDVFPGYTQDGFEAAVCSRFRIDSRRPVPGSERTLYLLTPREDDPS